MPVDDNGIRVADDALEPTEFRPGAELIIRDRASPSAAERVLTASVFADGEQPTWNIWEYDLESDTLRRIITSDINAGAGQNISPQYLADGRIVFASTRQRQARSILLDEGKPQYSGLTEDRDQEAFVLHVEAVEKLKRHDVF